MHEALQTIAHVLGWVLVASGMFVVLVAQGMTHSDKPRLKRGDHSMILIIAVFVILLVGFGSLLLWLTWPES